jgi:hypothetical protein
MSGQVWLPYPLGSSQIGVDFRGIIPSHPRLAWVSRIGACLAWGCAMKGARRKTGAPDEPASGLTGWKFAAPQPVIVSDRCNREPNDLDWAQPIQSGNCQLLVAIF